MAQALKTRDIAKDNSPSITIDIRKALELRERGYTYRDIAAKLGSNKSTVHKVLQPFLRFNKHPEATNAFEQKEGRLLSAAKFEVLRYLMDKRKLKEASVNNLAYAYGQLNQAERLFNGQSTENVGVMAGLADKDRNMFRDLARSFSKAKLEAARQDE